MLRTGKTQQYRREAPPVAEDTSSSTARLRPVQATSIIREIGYFCTASITLAPLRRTETTELTGKAKTDRDPVVGLRSLLVSAEGKDKNQPAIIPLRSTGGDSAIRSSGRKSAHLKSHQPTRPNLDCFAAGLA